MRTAVACLAALLLAAPARASAPPVQDRAGLFKPETVDAVNHMLRPVEERMDVEVRVVTVKDVPAVPAESRPAALADLARRELPNPAPRGTNDVLLILVAAPYRLVAVAAGPEPFAQRVTPGRREAMASHFARLFDDPDAQLPTAVEAACRDLVALLHPKLTILDNAGIFSPAAVHKAATELESYEAPFDVRLVIETFPALTERDKELTRQQVGKLGKRGLERRLDRLAKDRADNHRAAGLFKHAAYVLVVKDPPSVTVINYPSGFEGDLTAHRRDVLRMDLANRDPERPDAALFACVRHFKAAQEAQRPVISPLGTVPALALLGALVAAWVALRVVRRRLAGPDRPRLYTPALMGSLFGVPAGAWVYDQLFEAERPVTPVDPGDSFLQPPAPHAVTAEPALEGALLEEGRVVEAADGPRDPGAGEPL